MGLRHPQGWGIMGLCSPWQEVGILWREQFYEEAGKFALDHVKLNLLMLIFISKQVELFFFKNTLVLQGALVGLMAGFFASFWVGIGAQLYPPLPERTMPLSLETYGCNNTYNGSNWMTTTAMPFSTTAFQRYWIKLYNVIIFKNTCDR